MPRYRIHRIKETPREHFRWIPHTGGLTTVKPKDYDCNRELEAATPYAAWKLLEGEGDSLRPGDLLEVIQVEETGKDLRIFKYVGFEPAQWYIPEMKAETAPTMEFVPTPLSVPSSEQHS